VLLLPTQLLKNNPVTTSYHVTTSINKKERQKTDARGAGLPLSFKKQMMSDE